MRILYKFSNSYNINQNYRENKQNLGLTAYFAIFRDSRKEQFRDTIAIFENFDKVLCLYGLRSQGCMQVLMKMQML